MTKSFSTVFTSWSGVADARPLHRTGAFGAVLMATVLLSSSVQAQTRVLFGTAGNLGDASLAIHVAIERGYYKESGIEAEVVDFKGGAPAVQALVGNGIQYCICAPEHVVRLRDRGIDGVVAFAFDTKHTYALLTRKDSPIKSFEELKGQRVGITSSGSLTENLIGLQAKRSGLDAKKDLELVGAGVGAAQKAALDTGRIAAGMFGTINALQLGHEDYRVVFDWRTQTIPSLGLLAREKWLNDNKDAARAVAQATLKAQRLLLDNRDIAVAGLRKLYPELDAKVIDEVADSLPNRLSRDGLYTSDAWEQLQKDLVELEPQLRRVDFKVGNPDTFLKKAGS
ncbi:ABC transporter substrate-binding protein [Microvirga pudoricolor]|uniref:ABC transporter substrate-binding protein n=1 Tax=Microvirga pudoricolor TaxID=2778729 RepID=UPI00194E7BBD|nr:ABC transporter substrate-binding protein [Microvirga pudoricolor]MBM6596635.1 ABC transporter substrate-binding protein [Microvirga pudoricolor]